MVLLFLSKTALFPSQKAKKVVDHITLSCIVKTPACKNRDKYALNPMYYNPHLERARGCPGIAIFFKIKACSKNYRRHIVNILRIIF